MRLGSQVRHAIALAALCGLAGCTNKGDDDANDLPNVGTLAGQAAISGAGSGASAMTAGTSAGGTMATPGAGSSAPSGGTGTGTAGTITSSSGAGGSDPMMGDGGMPPETMEETCDKDLTPPAGADDCTAPLKPGDDRYCEKMIGGQMRQFYIYASPKFNPCKPASLIMDCHGLSESAEVHTGKEGFNLTGMMYPSGYGSGWRMAIQNDNAIVVTPQGIDQSWVTTSDVPFLNEAADTVEAIADIDPEHEYVTGISMGGMMTVATGCDDATRWRGMAPVAMLQQDCPGLAKPTPVISFHATGDQLTSYPMDQGLMGTIAGYNNCKAGPTEMQHYGGANTLPDPVCYVMPNGVGDPDAPDPLHVPLQPCPSTLPETSCVVYSECDDGVEVVFCTVDASTQPLGGHILYNNDTQLDLAEVAWPFFKKFWK